MDPSTASQLVDPATVSFLRIRNREGYDVYFRSLTGSVGQAVSPALLGAGGNGSGRLNACPTFSRAIHNAGYILLDLDHPTPGLLARLRAQGHEPSVLVQKCNVVAAVVNKEQAGNGPGNREDLLDLLLARTVQEGFKRENGVRRKIQGLGSC